ncbi:hypothetical protein [Mucilaginibacter sp. CSA2-8R]|uniref:hypothetical protein n=1 Tax=Mucilaginibacter sp. CSA2-8R TaxID=3141542 RepID=UPI00315D9368
MKQRLFSGSLLMTCLLVSMMSVAQTVGTPQPTQSMRLEVDGVRTNRYGNIEVDGSPFLTDNWTPGMAINDKGAEYPLLLKYDIVKDQPIFAGKDSDMMEFTVPINRFALKQDTYQNGYPAVDEWSKASYYKNIGSGKSKLLKHYYKKRIEVRDIGGLTGYKYEDNTAFYLFKDSKMTAVKPGKNGILDALSDKKGEVENFAKANKLNFKQDADLAKLMDYYSNL